MTDLAKLVVRLEAETAKYMKGMEDAQRKLDKFSGSTDRALTKIRNQILGAFTVKKIVDWAQASIDAADRIGKLSQSTGIATREISELGYAAGLSNIDVEELAKTLQTLANNAVDSTKAGTAQSKAFQMIGVSAKDAQGNIKDTDELLLEIADKFAGIEDGAQKAALAQDIFGKSGQKMIPFLNQGRAGIQALREEARRLGISLSDEAAKAAGDFNDAMSRVKAVSAGFVNQVVQQLLPSLTSLAEQFSDGAAKSELFARTADTVAVIVKGMTDFVLGAATAFQKLGTAIGAGAASAVQVAKGNFAQAKEIWQQATADNIAIEAEYQKAREALWSDANKKIIDNTQAASEKMKTVLPLGGKDLVQEISVTAKKNERGPVQELLDEFNQATKTSTELAQEQYNKEKEMLDVLLREKIISIDTYNERISESFDKFIPPFEVTVNRIKDTTKKATDELSEYQKEAQRNTQDIIAKGLGDAIEGGVEEGAKGALEAFGEMIEKMILQALAAKLADKLFGTPSSSASGGGGGTSGILDSIIPYIFGGTKDSGGRGRKGMAYAIGTGAQPEMFVPDTDGTFYPRDQWATAGGMAGVTQNIYVEGRPDPRTARQMEIEAARRQRAASSRLG